MKESRGSLVRFPRQQRLVTADDRTRAEAKRKVAAAKADGGTAIGEWLLLADRLFADHSGQIKHAILLTDGRNEHEEPAKLDRILRRWLAGSPATAAGCPPVESETFKPTGRICAMMDR